MSATKVTYATKENGGRPKTVHVKQWWFEDANEVKAVTDNHADRINQFTFNNPLNGDVGLGVTPTSRFHIRGVVGQDSLLKLQTIAGLITLQADENGSVWSSGATGDTTNTHFGFESGLYNTSTGSSGYGNNSLRNNTADLSSGFGNSSLQNNTGPGSNGMGFLSLFSNSGFNCNGFGNNALQSNSANDSAGFGASVLQFNSGARSSGFNVYCLQNNSGNDVSGYGYTSLRNNAGNNNSAIGSNSGSENDVLLGSDNTFLGYNASYSINVNINNATAVGANVTLSQSNSVILGDNADVGIGTTAPTAKLHVVSTTKGTIPFPLMTSAERLAIATPATGLHVYQTDGTEGVYVNKSTGWIQAY